MPGDPDVNWSWRVWVPSHWWQTMHTSVKIDRKLPVCACVQITEHTTELFPRPGSFL